MSFIQSSPATTVRNVEGISRQNPTQHGKAVSVSRRPLPAILPKTIPPKALTTVSSPGRKLASILPAPAKSTSSSLPNPLIVPVVVSSGSSPIPIAPSPRPPQPPGLTSSVMNKVTSVSMATGQSNDLKRYDTSKTPCMLVMTRVITYNKKMKDKERILMNESQAQNTNHKI